MDRIGDISYVACSGTLNEGKQMRVVSMKMRNEEVKVRENESQEEV